ncbi:MAG: hypothetical protein AB2A00_00760 [Myxococcota bacterium]
MKPVALLLMLALSGTAAAAPARNPAEARAAVAKQAHQVEVYLAARERLLKERAAQQARADALAAEVAQAKRNRGLLSDAALKARLSESVEVGKALEATDRKLSTLDRMLEDAVAGMERSVAREGKDLPAADRKALEAEAARARAALQSSRQALPSAQGGVQVTASMDAEALSERADLARDYEEKLRKEALKAEERIRTLEEQASLAGEARMFAQDRQLFDEEERALRASRVVQRPGAQSTDEKAGGVTARTDDDQAARNEATGPQAGGSPAPADPGTGAFNGETDATDVGGGGNAAPPPSAPTTAGGVNVPRSQTVVDERTFALLRESRSPMAGLSTAEELRRLKERREALLKAAARLKAVQEELRTRAAQSNGKPAQTAPANNAASKPVR